MKAILFTGAEADWARPLGHRPWPLVPLANRPLLEYWIEWCVEAGIRELRVVFGHGAAPIEAYAGDGRRWGLSIEYSFLRDGQPPVRFLQRAPDRWREEGVALICGPLFPRRITTAPPRLPDPGTTRGVMFPGGAQALFCHDPVFFDGWLAGTRTAADAPPPEDLGLELAPVSSLKEYFDLNLRLAAGEIVRYLAPGYGAVDGSLVGYNVILPPSVRATPPVLIGNETRIGALASVGPLAVIGNHVVVDRGSVLTRCVVLDGTYIGAGLEVNDRIVAGDRLIDPADGTTLEIGDSLLLAEVRPVVMRPRDLLRAVQSVLLAWLVLAVQLLPWALLYLWIRFRGHAHYAVRAVHGRRQKVQWMEFLHRVPAPREAWSVQWFCALGLDLAPRVMRAALGRCWLCGHEPLHAPEENALREELTAYFPAAFSYATPRRGAGASRLRAVEARYYVHHRSVWEDLGILARGLLGRLAPPAGGD